LIRYDITISTSSDQIALGPGNLAKEWKESNRNFFRYTCDTPGIYSSAGIFSATYSIHHDSVLVNNNRAVDIDLYYLADHNKNLSRFVSAYKDGLNYYTTAFGPYPFKQVRLVESPVYGPGVNTMAASDIYAERFGWNADLRNPDRLDYCYFVTARQLARQWWGNQVAPNHTRGSALITEGLSKFCALVMYEKRYGRDNLKTALQEVMNNYIWGSRWYSGQRSLLQTGMGYGMDSKAAIVLFGLKDLIGELPLIGH
jgi:ABC-2 type transport system permease protein